MRNNSCVGGCRRRQGQNPRDGFFAGGLRNSGCGNADLKGRGIVSGVKIGKMCILCRHENL